MENEYKLEGKKNEKRFSRLTLMCFRTFCRHCSISRHPSICFFLEVMKTDEKQIANDVDLCTLAVSSYSPQNRQMLRLSPQLHSFCSFFFSLFFFKYFNNNDYYKQI